MRENYGKLKIYEGLSELSRALPLILPDLPNLTLEVYELNKAMDKFLEALEDDMVGDAVSDGLFDLGENDG